MHIGIGLALGQTRVLGEVAAPTVNDQTVNFGALTIAGAGGAQVVNTSSDLVDLTSYDSLVSGSLGSHTPVVSGGRLTFSGAAGAPSGAVLRCSHAGGAVDITISTTANFYSVVTHTEAQAALLAASGGETVRFRSGVTDHGTADIRLASNKTYSTNVTLTGETGAIIRPRLRFENSVRVTVEDLRVEDPDGNNFSLIDMTGDCDEFVIQDNVLRGKYHDPFGDYSAAGSYSNNPAGIKTTQGASGLPVGVTIRRNDVRNVEIGVTVQNTGALAITDNVILYTYQDPINHTPRTENSALSKDISRNFVGFPVGLATDDDNPHWDGVQLKSTVENDGVEMINYLIEQNVILANPAVSRGDAGQGIAAFEDSNNNFILKDAIVRANLILAGGNNHMTFEAVDGGQLYSNTLIGITDTTGGARLNLTVASGGSEPALRGNITERALTGGATATEVDSLAVGQGGATNSYASVFSAFNRAPTTFAEMIAGLSMAANGPADLDDSGTGTEGDAGAVGTGAAVFGSPLDATGWSLDSSYAPVAAASEVVFDSSDTFDLRAAGVPATSDKMTLAMRFKMTTASQFTYLVNDGGNMYVRNDFNGQIDIRLRDSTNADVLIASDVLGTAQAVGEYMSILMTVDTAGSLIFNANGTVEHNESVNANNGSMKMPGTVNGQNPGDLNVVALTVFDDIGTGVYSDFFDGSGEPTSAMISGAAIGGITPVFSQSGDAAAWNAAHMTGAVTDA